MTNDYVAHREYFTWLCDLIDGSENYINLMTLLFQTDFVVLIPNDDNRASDGIELRHEFCSEEGQHALSQWFFDRPCTVLEMLIALCDRLELETIQSRWEKTPSEWFWILMDNLDFVDFDDISWDDVEYRESILNGLKIMLNRQYLPSGEGGLFPLNVPLRDQRRIELWYQMSAYVLENYPI